MAITHSNSIIDMPSLRCPRFFIPSIGQPWMHNLTPVPFCSPPSGWQGGTAAPPIFPLVQLQRHERIPTCAKSKRSLPSILVLLVFHKYLNKMQTPPPDTAQEPTASAFANFGHEI